MRLRSRRLLPLALSLAILASPASAAASLGAQSVSQTAANPLAGEWIFEMEGDAQPQRVVFTAAGDSVEGKVYGQSLRGVVARDRLAFAVGDYRWRAAVRGDSLVGWLGIGADSSRWQAHRVRRPASPRTFAPTPSSYPRRIGAEDAPLLRIHPGDTVRIATLDAGGWGPGAFGARGNKRAMGGNPLVGPFYVEGAVPGDVLVVRLHRVRLDRDWAFSGTGLVDNAITPAYAAERKFADQDNKWTLDTVAGVARLQKPPAALRNFTVPLRPFLGVVAVAPGGDGAPSSRESGSWGGNMELGWIREGATVMLPVSHMGARLYLGDGHAAQGDGELTGDALETSMQVAFTVEIRRWGFQELTRVEDAEQIMSVGVGGSLDEAMRRATSDLARWLQQDYKLSATEAALVLGFAVQFDIADVVPPGFGVTARLPRAALRQITGPTR